MARPIASATRTVQFIRQPQDSIGVLCSIPSILYNSSSSSIIMFKVQMAEGSELVVPDDAAMGFVRKGSTSNAPAVWLNGRTVSGVRLDYALDTEALSVTLTINQDATLEGMLHINLRYKGKTYPYSLSVIKVEDCVEGAPGDNGIAFLCSTSSVVYKDGEASSYGFEVCVMDGAAKVLPEYVSGRLVTNRGTVDFSSSLNHNGMALSHTAASDHYDVSLSFTDDCLVEGELQLSYQYKAATYTARIPIIKVGDGIPGINAAVLISDTAAVAYNPSQATSLVVQAMIRDGYDYRVPTFVSAKLIGVNNTILKTFTLLGATYKNMTAAFEPGDDCHKISLSFAAAEFSQSAFGVLEVRYDYSGQPFTLRLPITRVQNGEQGDNAIMLVPSLNSVVYNPSEYVAKAITFEIADGARRIPKLLSDVRFNGEEVVSGIDSDDDGLILTWLGHTSDQGLTIELDEEATAEGVIDVSTVYEGQTYSTQINIVRVQDGEDGEDAVEVVCDISALSYNPSQPSYKQFNVGLRKGGVDITTAFTAYLTDPEGDVLVHPVSSTVIHKGVAFSYGRQNLIGFRQGAEYEGALRMELQSFDIEPVITRTLQIPITRVLDGEKGDNAVRLETSCNSVVYNNAAGYQKNVSVLIKDGGETVNVSLASVKFNGTDMPVSGNYTANGMTLSYGPPSFNAHTGVSTPATVALSFEAGATAQGTVEVAASYNGKQYRAEISVLCVKNGQEGPQGPRGFKGCYIRGPRIWQDVKDSHSDRGELLNPTLFYSGAASESFIDVVLHNFKLWACKTTHAIITSHEPGTDSGEWEEFTEFEAVSTKLLLAEKELVNNLVVKEVTMFADDGQTIIFGAYRDESNQAHVYATMGHFKNVIVEGDIRCNTQTYEANMFEDPHPLTEGGAFGAHDAIEIKPEGGCIIIPPGKSDLVVLLPEVAPGTVRQVTVINQKLPFRGTMQNGRGIFLMCDTENVWVFPKLTTTEGAINSTGNANITLEYGAYSLYGYHMTVPINNQNKDITVWSLWRTDIAEPEYGTPGTLIRPVNPGIINGVASTLPQL